MPTPTHSLNRPLRLGFVALADCAPLAVAKELGLFEAHGLDVELNREVGWATIRDKIIYGELDAAQAPAGLLVAANCGLGSIQAECLTGLVLNLHGNAITLSENLWKSGVRDGASLAAEIARGRHKYTFGVVHSFSSHHILLRTWLRAHRIDPVHDVSIVVVPPAQMHANLKAGNLDGYCVGEPWNSVAVMAKTGWCVATSAELAPGHLEKVLMVRSDFSERPEHLALIAALMEACRICDQPEYRDQMIDILAQPKYVGTTRESIRRGISGLFDYGHGRMEKDQDFHIFSGGGANRPTLERAQWLIRGLHSTGIISDPSQAPITKASEWFRTDIFQAAVQLLPASIAAI